MQKYYGSKANDFITYEETVWRKEHFTYTGYEPHILPHQNNGDSFFKETFLDGQFFIAGAETVSTHLGYMDGAIISTNQTAEKVIRFLLSLK